MNNDITFFELREHVNSETLSLKYYEVTQLAPFLSQVELVRVSEGGSCGVNRYGMGFRRHEIHVYPTDAACFECLHLLALVVCSRFPLLRRILEPPVLGGSLQKSFASTFFCVNSLV